MNVEGTYFSSSFRLQNEGLNKRGIDFPVRSPHSTLSNSSFFLIIMKKLRYRRPPPALYLIRLKTD